MERELITIPEAGKRFFGVSKDTAFALAAEGVIPTVQVGKRRKVDVAVLRATIKQYPEAKIVELVKRNIGTIEVALLLLSNSDDVHNHSGMPPQEIARLANALREAYDECSS